MATLQIALALTGLVGASQPGETGWAPLFDGKDLSGWSCEGDPKGWTVEDGVLVTTGKIDGGWLKTDREYGNFVLRIEYMISGVGNSGIRIRSYRPDSVSPEVQILAPWTPTRDELHCTGSLYGHVAVSRRPDETPLAWHSMGIVCSGKDIRILVDGEVCTRANTDQVLTLKGLPPAGAIALQSSHSGPDEWVKFRRISIRDLDQDPVYVGQALRSSDAAARVSAQNRAAEIGAAMVPRLLALYDEATPQATRVARETLEWLVARASAREAARGAVEQALDAEVDGAYSGEARALAAGMLAFVGTDLSVAKLAGVLGDPVIRENALRSLISIGGPQACRALAESLGSLDDPGKLAVVVALGALRDPDTVDALTGEARDGAGPVRPAALRALGAIGDARAAETLVDASRSEDSDVRRAAIDGMLALAERQGDRGLSALLFRRASIPGATRGQRMRALAGARDLGDEKLVEDLEQAARTLDPGTLDRLPR